MYILLNVAFATVSILSSAIAPENNPIAIRREANNWGFILFFVCFFIIANIITDRNRFLIAKFNRLFRKKDKNNMFYENVTNETVSKIILSLQTVIVISVIVYRYAIYENFLPITTLTQMLITIGKGSLLLTAFFLYKFISYSVAGAIFFKKETVIQWSDDFFSLVSINGIFLFLPALIFFYLDTIFSFFVSFFVFYLICNMLFIFYKIKTLFFKGNRYLLYFILYLCTQEIIPLYLVYRGFVYLIAQKETIWM